MNLIQRMGLYRRMNKKTIDPTLVINQSENVEIGLAMLKNKHSDSHQKIIILLDINMPMFDGWGFLEKLRKSIFNNLDNFQFILFFIH